MHHQFLVQIHQMARIVYFDSVRVRMCIILSYSSLDREFPLFLHFQLGLGNDVHSKLIEFLAMRIEKLSQEELDA